MKESKHYGRGVHLSEGRRWDGEEKYRKGARERDMESTGKN